jgi:hypothetical protein
MFVIPCLKVYQADFPRIHVSLFGWPIMKIGVITVPDPSKGLHREAELIAWVFDKSPKTKVEIVHMNTIQTDSIDNGSVPSSQPTSYSIVTTGSVREWINTVDVLFVLEVVNVNILDYAIQKTKVVLVPNLEWATMKENNIQSTSFWTKLVRKYCSEGMIVVAKSMMIKESLKSNKITSELVNWSIPDPILIKRTPTCDDTKTTVLMNAGQGGWKNRRGVDVFIEAIKFIPTSVNFNFVLKTIKPWSEYELGPLPDNLTLVEGFVSRAELKKITSSTDLVIYPSRFEGFGLSMLEAMHQGIPVMCTDGWPMNEIQTIKSKLLLIDSLEETPIRLAMAFEPNPRSIVENLVILQSMDIRKEFPIELVTKGLIQRQEMFVKALLTIAGL